MSSHGRETLSACSVVPGPKGMAAESGQGRQGQPRGRSSLPQTDTSRPALSLASLRAQGPPVPSSRSQAPSWPCHPACCLHPSLTALRDPDHISSAPLPPGPHQALLSAWPGQRVVLGAPPHLRAQPHGSHRHSPAGISCHPSSGLLAPRKDLESCAGGCSLVVPDPVL